MVLDEFTKHSNLSDFLLFIHLKIPKVLNLRFSCLILASAMPPPAPLSPASAAVNIMGGERHQVRRSHQPRPITSQCKRADYDIQPRAED